VHTVQHAPDKQTALKLIKDEMEARLSLHSPLSPEESSMLSQSLHKRAGELKLPKVKIEKEDIYGAIACFWLVTVSCLSAAVPFFIFSEPTLALRVSNAILIILLYLVGRRWAHYAGTNRLLTGLSMVTIGLLLVGVSILLGG
jgi:VIT1/CCC1 family predicted Fe2+/Mn2+ transporter